MDWQDPLEPDEQPHTVSIVIPVYHGERTLPGLLAEIATMAPPRRSEGRLLAEVAEVVLVFDNGTDHSDEVMRRLAKDYDFVRTVWLPELRTACRRPRRHGVDRLGLDRHDGRGRPAQSG